MNKLLTTLLLLNVLFFIPDLYAQDEEPAKQETDVLKIYSKFDFIPGEKVIFFDDFLTDAVGDFPGKWNTNASGEIVSANKFPGKWLQLKGEGFYIPETPVVFPENFTAEFDFVATNDKKDEDGYLGFGFYVVSGDMKNPNEGGAIPGKAGNKISFDNWTASYSSYSNGEYNMDGNTEFNIQKNKKYHMSVWVQKQRLRVYIDERKLFDIPRGIPEGYKYNILRFELGDESHPMISNFRVAVGAPDMRNKLLTEGKLISYGIYFDVNSDVVKPESNGTLKEIAQVLKDNEGVKIRIVGHTDGDGADAANLDLSKRRAAAVKNELVARFGIAADRIQTDGKGKTQPLVANDNSSNKAKNRRVEFIKI